VLTKTHRAIKFTQRAWLKEYIDINVELRKEATRNNDKVGKDLYKLMCNAVFGKTMENVRKRQDIELITNPKVAKKRFAKPNFSRAVRFHDDLIAVKMHRTKLQLDRPIQVGFTILDLSKVHMYNFHYNVWLSRFPKSTLLFTDTDSLCYAVDHSLEQMRDMQDIFDFSDYPTDHPLHSVANMKVVGKFKDELNGRCMKKFVGLRPKLYSFLKEGDDGSMIQSNTAKGVKTSVKNTKLSFSDYEETLREMNKKIVSMNTIRSTSHQLHSVTIKKIALSAFDDKRYICADGVTTLVHGHSASKWSWT
jgi:hypothetical protein